MGARATNYGGWNDFDCIDLEVQRMSPFAEANYREICNTYATQLYSPQLYSPGVAAACFRKKILGIWPGWSCPAKV
ncbi:hypothetical protein KTH_63270 [Thermosporothrix hazakensis]|nr:hypothetical protein KTH_63270 [Thermosporothrix hazakensis]